MWDIEPDDMLVDVAEQYSAAIHQAIYQIMRRYSAEIEAWMKSNAAWTDRTSNARQGLYSEVEDVVNQTVTIIFGHTMTYGIFLELANGGRYAIIAPAIDYFLPKIWADIQILLR